MSTHIGAQQGEIAKVVLMPGDPLRAKYIAEKYLEDVKMFNNVRNMFGYTGYYHGKQISVMGSGMGNASIGIYSYELFKKYDVDRIIRIGTTGSYVKELNVYDVVLLDSCYSDSSYAWVQARVKDNVMYPSEELNEIIRRSAKKLCIEISEKQSLFLQMFI